MSGPNPRAAAVAALVRQEQDGFSNLILDAELRRQKLEGRDKAFASAIFYTVLEHQGTLDYILSQFLPKGLARLDPQVREILRAALAQARYMQVPASAAVNEAVKLTRAFRKASASGLVNAVLRRAIGYDLGSAVFADEVERLMVLGSAGRDVAAFLHEHYPDEALDILTHTADGGLTSLRANPLKGTPEALCEKLLASGAKTAAPGLVPGSVLARFEGSPAESGLFRDGYFHVEGQASQLAALCVEAKPGDTVLDLCAAPGGKSFSAAFAMEDKGEIVSCDLHENKLKRIQEGAARLDLTSITTSAGDGRVFRPEWAERFDTVLVDAPCSGLGIIRKKPDVRYKKADDLFTLPVIQTALLDNAAKYVAPGGVLVYSTCTILPEENEQVTDTFLAEHSEFCREGFTLPEPVGETEGQLTLWPQRHGTDGFYICRMTRRP